MKLKYAFRNEIRSFDFFVGNQFTKAIVVMFFQLAQVDETLKLCKSEAERESLENLKCDLNELLELTRDTLREQTDQSSKRCKRDDASNDGNGDDGGDVENEKDDIGDPYKAEMALLMAEINSCETAVRALDAEAAKNSLLDNDTTPTVLDQFKVSALSRHRNEFNALGRQVSLAGDRVNES